MLDNSILAKDSSIIMRLLSVIIIFTSQLCTPALGDQCKSQPNKSAVKPSPLESYQKLKDAPTADFPDLPVFRVKTKFLGGFYSPNKNGISICQMNYVSQEDTKTIIDFYKDAFSSNGWKIQFANGPAIDARHKDGHLCSVNVMDSKLPSIKSQFTVAYRQLVK